MSDSVSVVVNKPSLLRQDGVYIQFITSPMRSQYATSSGCAYNIIKIIDGRVDQIKREPRGDKTLFMFGSLSGVLYDHHVDESDKLHNQLDQSSWEAGCYKKNKEAIKLACKELNLINLDNPLQTAKDIYNLPINQLDSELLRKNNPNLSVEGFANWELAIPLKGYDDSCLHPHCCTESHVYDKNIAYIDSQHCDKTIGCIDSPHCNNQMAIYYKDNVEVIYKDKYSQNLDDGSPDHPYVFYTIGENAKQSNEFETYYKQWLKAKTNTGCEEFEKLILTHFNHLIEIPITLDPHYGERVDIDGHSCDVCGRDQFEWMKDGVYTCKTDDKDCCASCSLTPDGKKLLSEHEFTFHNWIRPAVSPDIILDSYDIKKLYGEPKVEALDGEYYSDQLNGLVLIRYDNGDVSIRGVMNDRYHGDCLTQKGTYYPTYEWSIYVNGYQITNDQYDYKIYRKLWKDCWLGGSSNKNTQAKFLIPQKFINLLE